MYDAFMTRVKNILGRNSVTLTGHECVIRINMVSVIHLVGYGKYLCHVISRSLSVLQSKDQYTISSSSDSDFDFVPRVSDHLPMENPANDHI